MLTCMSDGRGTPAAAPWPCYPPEKVVTGLLSRVKFSDAELQQHGVCRRAPGVPCHDVLDGWGTCILLLLHEERLRVQGMRRRAVHQFELCLQEWHAGLLLRECPRTLF